MNCDSASKQKFYCNRDRRCNSHDCITLNENIEEFDICSCLRIRKRRGWVRKMIKCPNCIKRMILHSDSDKIKSFVKDGIVYTERKIRFFCYYGQHVDVLHEGKLTKILDSWNVNNINKKIEEISKTEKGE